MTVYKYISHFHKTNQHHVARTEFGGDAKQGREDILRPYPPKSRKTTREAQKCTQQRRRHFPSSRSINHNSQMPTLSIPSWWERSGKQGSLFSVRGWWCFWQNKNLFRKPGGNTTISNDGQERYRGRMWREDNNGWLTQHYFKKKSFTILQRSKRKRKVIRGNVGCHCRFFLAALFFWVLVGCLSH